MPRNRGEFDRGGAAAGQRGEASRRAMQDQETGAQSRARPEEKGDVERQREKLDGAERRRLKDALENERQRLTRK